MTKEERAELKKIRKERGRSEEDDINVGELVTTKDGEPVKTWAINLFGRQIKIQITRNV